MTSLEDARAKLIDVLREIVTKQYPNSRSINFDSIVVEGKGFALRENHLELFEFYWT